MPPDPDKPLTPEEQQKADRALRILYAAMAVMVVLPFVLLWYANRNK